MLRERPKSASEYSSTLVENADHKEGKEQKHAWSPLPGPVAEASEDLPRLWLASREAERTTSEIHRPLWLPSEVLLARFKFFFEDIYGVSSSMH